MSSSSSSTCACTETSSADTASSAISTSGSQRERARDADALALAAGELVRIAVAARRVEAAPARISSRARVARASRVGAEVRSGPSMIDCADRPARIERAIRVLEHDLHARARTGAARRRASLATSVPATQDRRPPSARSAARCSAPPSTCPSPIRRRCRASRRAAPPASRRRPRHDRGACRARRRVT